MNSSFLNIYLAFLKIGAILLGGGYVIVPIMQSELVEKRNWLTEQELCDYYCVSQCLPGIIAIKMSMLGGYKILHPLDIAYVPTTDTWKVLAFA